jgi:hypothetical protein
MHGFVPLRLRHSAPAPREMRVSAAAFVDDRFGQASTLTRINADTSALRRVSGRVQRRASARPDLVHASRLQPPAPLLLLRDPDSAAIPRLAGQRSLPSIRGVLDLARDNVGDPVTVMEIGADKGDFNTLAAW